MMSRRMIRWIRIARHSKFKRRCPIGQRLLPFESLAVCLLYFNASVCLQRFLNIIGVT